MTDSSGVSVSPLPGNVYLMKLTGNGQHRYNQGSIAAINRALDEVEGDPNAAALVTTNEGKFFSNGLDLASVENDSKKFEHLERDFQALLKRMLLFPLPTIAAICGHAAAGGCMFALAHDYRVMAADKGYIFLSEVDIKIPLSPGMNALIQCKIPGNAFYKAVLSGYRFTGKTAVEHGFVDAALPDASSTVNEAQARAKALAARKFDRITYTALKTEMFKNQIMELDRKQQPGVIEKILSKL